MIRMEFEVTLIKTGWVRIEAQSEQEAREMVQDRISKKSLPDSEWEANFFVDSIEPVLD
jgi:hypothetical protein